MKTRPMSSAVTSWALVGEFNLVPEWPVIIRAPFSKKQCKRVLLRNLGNKSYQNKESPFLR